MNAATIAKLAAEAAPPCAPQIAVSPSAEPPVKPCRISASACVPGRIFAKIARPFGSTEIGNNEPAKNHGTIAIAGTLPMYSCSDVRRYAMTSARDA